MSIRFRCPKCGQDQSVSDSSAGQTMACSQCHQPLRVPGTKPSGESSTSQSQSKVINFRCEGCGTSYATSASLAGKKVKCKSCGQGIRVPGSSESAPVTVAASQGASSAARRPAPRAQVKADPAPGGLSVNDLYGLDEAPVTNGRPSSSDGVFQSQPATAEAEDKLPPRAGAYEPMTATKKKQIAKRAAKVEKARPTFGGTGMGMSFGGVLMFALIGWRVYRTVNRFNNPRPNGFQAVPGGLNNVDFSPRAVAAQIDKDVAESIGQPGSAEAREWLDPVKHPNHGVFEMDIARARAMVTGFYERGAKRVTALDPATIGNNTLVASFAVELPKDLDKRKKCFEWEVQYLQGDDPTTELGQKYLLISTD